MKGSTRSVAAANSWGTFGRCIEWLESLSDKYWINPDHKAYHYETFFMRLIFAVATYKDFYFGTASVCPVIRDYPNGIAAWIPVDWMCEPAVIPIMKLLLVVAIVMYLFDRTAPFGLLYIAMYHTGWAAIKSSDGVIGHSNQGTSLALLAQSLYYGPVAFKRIVRFINRRWKVPFVQHTKWINLPDTCDEENNHSLAVYYSQQAMCAVYITCAITKDAKSGGNWMESVSNIVLQVVKSNDEQYYTQSRGSSLESNWMASTLVSVIIAFPIVSFFTFGFAFFAEKYCMLFLFNRITLLFGGVALYGMHEMIRITMQLNFVGFKRIIFAQWINLPFWIVWAYHMVRGRPYPILVTKDDKNEDKSDASETRKVSKSILQKISNRRRRPWALFKMAWKKFPFKLAFFMIFCCVTLEEWYPFSHFPMYANSSRPSATYYMITDGDDGVFQTFKVFQFKAPFLKKKFGKVSMKEVCDFSTGMCTPGKDSTLVERAANHTLRSIFKETEPHHRKYDTVFPWKIYRVDVTKENGVIYKNPVILGTMDKESALAVATPQYRKAYLEGKTAAVAPTRPMPGKQFIPNQAPFLPNGVFGAVRSWLKNQ
eukprot:TRINITY_DN3399_c0_g1_i1.p1 TRINITY_DN3399_c0_g1~~TRINITY_DN3399_c0_g1_i1.p1  ORF type:complete len:597 (+),score=214.76 TRINITY_DN3399_c0_g1_i1:74-1864(+)